MSEKERFRFVLIDGTEGAEEKVQISGNDGDEIHRSLWAYLRKAFKGGAIARHLETLHWRITWPDGRVEFAKIIIEEE